MLSFSSGVSLAKTDTSSTIFFCSAKLSLLNSSPVTTLSLGISANEQIFCVASTLSPVNILVVIPTLFKLLIVFLTPGLIGSSKATTPKKTNPLSSVILLLVYFLLARAITCIPFLLNSLALVKISSLTFLLSLIISLFK